MTARDVFVRVRATGRLWNTLLVGLDAAVVVLATVLAYYVRFEGPAPEAFSRWIAPLAGAAVVVYGVLFALFGLYRLVLRFVGVDALLRLLGAVTLGFALLLAVNMLMPLEEAMRPVPVGVLFIQAVLVFMGAAAARLAARIYLYLRSARPGMGRRVLIVGAGSAGALLLREIQNRPDLDLDVVGFLDDETALHHRTLGGVPVLGRTEDLAEVVARKDVEEIVVAMPSAPKEMVRRILNAAADAGVQTRVMPELVIAKGSVSLRDLRAVDVEDLLGREPTPIDVEQVRETLAG
ncbi:MAG: nucleoside-diphosphate sugar epimerase/dehydratase, partial [Anaerosomatales bacterium]